MKHYVKTRISWNSQGIVTQIPLNSCNSFSWIFKSTLLDSQHQNLKIFVSDVLV